MGAACQGDGAVLAGGSAGARAGVVVAAARGVGGVPFVSAGGDTWAEDGVDKFSLGKCVAGVLDSSAVRCRFGFFLVVLKRPMTLFHNDGDDDSSSSSSSRSLLRGVAMLSQDCEASWPSLKRLLLKSNCKLFLLVCVCCGEKRARHAATSILVSSWRCTGKLCTPFQMTRTII
jgi:hypothetical protein